MAANSSLVAAGLLKSGLGKRDDTALEVVVVSMMFSTMCLTLGCLFLVTTTSLYFGRISWAAPMC